MVVMTKVHSEPRAEWYVFSVTPVMNGLDPAAVPVLLAARGSAQVKQTRRRGATTNVVVRDSLAAETAITVRIRLRVLAAVYAVIALVAAAVVLSIDAGALAVPVTGDLGFGGFATAIGLVAALVMIAASYSRALPPWTLLALGTVFQIAGALLIAIVENAITPGGIGVSFASLWILSFTIVPATPRRAAITAYAAAATVPLALAIHAALGSPVWPPTWLETLSVIAVFVAAAIAVLTSRVIYGLGVEIADARRLGAYQMVELLGKGGMGEVWRAEHESLIRPAAVKLLRRELTAALGPAEMEALNLRFQREVQATATLSSPHTVAVFDFGHTGDGTLYYVMELLDGLDLESLVRRCGPQPAERVIHIMTDVCASLAEAHHRGLVHRDIKPANIYVCAVGMELDFAKVLDFGLVRDLNTSERLTVEGSLPGTPAYLAPETAEQNQYDTRSDLYALGCVAYWLLTGRLVFDAATAAAMMAAHLRDAPSAPSRRGELPIPPELDAIVLACLAKDPDARPQSAGELAQRLAAVPIASPWTPDRAEAWWRTHLPDIVTRARSAATRPTANTMRYRPRPVVRERIERR
jgi:serine/threonine-protein kinase